MLSWLGLLKLALANLRINKARSALTVLGMVFGTGAVIATLSSNDGAARFIRSELEKMGTNTITVRAEGTHGNTFQPEDVHLLKKYSPHFSTLNEVNRSHAQVRYGSELSSVELFGVESSFLRAIKLETKVGRFFDDEELIAHTFVAIIGHTVKNGLFGNDRALGHYVHLYSDDAVFPFRIVGVFPEKGGQNGAPIDGGFFIPSSVAKKIVSGRSTSSYLAATLLNDDESPQAKTLISVLLGPRFPQGLQISDAREAIERTKGIWEKQNLVGICLAMVSLLTGGVGIMNIMLLSVAQRRKEIGLRKAVGANNLHILIQFLIEAVTVCLVGGIIGIIAGTLFGKQVAQMMGQWEAVISPYTIAYALLFAMLTGVIFGLLPAYRASRLDPYEALRS